MHAGPLRLLQLLAAAERLEDFEDSLTDHFGRLPDPGSLVEFFDIPTGDAFDVAPEQAISFFKGKGLKPTFSYADMLNRAHDQAFTVAKMMDVDLLTQMKASLDSAQANGLTFKQWSDSIVPILQQGGWWGRKEVVDPLTGKVVVAQLGSPARLETIFRTNMMSSYAAGQWQEIEAQADVAPYLMYDAVDDFRTRPLHAKWDKTILPVDSPWWRTHYPPNGWNSLVPDQRVSASAVLGLKAWYSGEVVEVVGQSGGRFTVTAQHPVLTLRGWVDAKDLREGDELVAYGAEVGRSAVPTDLDEHNAPPTIAQVFEALSASARASVPRAALHLNGDSLRFEGDVEVVGADRKLVDAVEAAALEFARKVNLLHAGQRARLRLLLGTLRELLISASAAGGTSGSATGDLDQAVVTELANLGEDRIRLDPLRAQVSSDVLSALAKLGGDLAQAHPAFVEAQDILRHWFSDLGPLAPAKLRSDELRRFRAGALDPRIADDPVGGFGVNADAASDIVDRHAGQIQIDRVAALRFRHYDGHVYDLQTVSGTIMAYGGENMPHYVVSNCRCGVIQLSAEELEGLGLKPSTDMPADGTYTWLNPRTGAKEQIPQGLDPGFVNNSGKSHVGQLKALLAEKMKANRIQQKGALKEALQKQDYLANEAKALDDAAALKAREASLAQQERANATSAKAVAAAKAAAEKQAALLAAKAQVEAIAQGKYAGVGKGYLEKAYGKLSKSPDWQATPADQQMAQIEAEAAAQKLKTETASKLATYKKAVLEGKIPAPSLVKALKSLPDTEQAAFLAKIDAEKAAIEAKKAAEAKAKAEAAAEAAKKAKASEAAKKAAATKAAKKAAQAAPSPAAEPPPPTPVASAVAQAAGTPPNPSNLTEIGAKTKGGTPGVFVQDTTTGQKWLLKFPDSEDNVRNEVLASKLYQMAGLEAPELHLIRYKGKPALASRVIEGFREVDAAELAANAAVQEGFAVDAWLSNWDSIGMGFENTVLKGTGAIRIDVGGSLRYRALGGLKGDAFGDEVLELDSLRDPRTAPQAAKVYGKATQAQIEAGVRKVLAVQDDDIRAAVEQFGPLDARERTRLADRLIARKADLARRFPQLAKPKIEPPAPVATAKDRVTPIELKAIADSRANGYALTIDGPDLEDHQVVVSHFTGADGKPGTRSWFKVRPGAQKKLLDSIRKIAGTEDLSRPRVSLERWRLAGVTAVKGINKRATEGARYETKDVDRLLEAIAQSRGLLRDIDEAIPKAASTVELKAARKEVADWLEKFEAIVVIAKKLGPANKIPGKFPVAGESAVQYDLKAAPKPKAAAVPAINWTRKGSLEVETATFDKARPKFSSKKTTVSGVSEVYEAQLPDGSRVRFVPDTPNNEQAMKGLMYVDAPGQDAKAAARALELLDDLGLNAKRATDLDRQVLYLNQFAELRLGNDRIALDDFLRLDEKLSGDALVKEKLRILKAKTGVDIEKSRGWGQVNGVRQAFGHGRAYTIRPDLDTPDFDQFNRSHWVYHNPQSLGPTGDWHKGVAEHLLTIINGGGQAASQVDRMRRGAYFARGSSVTADIRTGGADYFFTRLRTRTSRAGPGFYWKANVVKRTDAVSYEGDMFGGSTRETRQYRKGKTVAELKDVAGNSGNETVFKNGLSVFDDLEQVLVYDEAERTALIAELKNLGYPKWPDGRQLTDVIKVAVRK